MQLVSYRLERPGLSILPHAIPLEAPPVHRHVYARLKHLHERERAAEIEQAVRTAERVRHHRAGEDDGFPGLARAGCRERLSGLDHRVGAVREEDARLGALSTLVNDARAIRG